MNYLEWINQCTPTRWWHDSGNPDEIELAIRRGATGVTTNPVLTFRSFQSQPEFWNPKVVALGDDFEPEARAEALLKLVATYAAEKVRPVYERTNGADGYALGQLNPTRAGDAEGMLAQARRVHSWAENIAVKLPATAAGIEVIEHLAEEGIPICATINVSVSQAIAVAEAYARGKQKALAAGVKPPLCIVVQQVGRLDDYLRDVAQDMKLGLDESVITMAGLAVAKRTYQIFEQCGYDAVIMPAGLRGAYHLTEMAGGKLLYTINTRVQDMILAADPPQEERISNPVPQDILDQLRKIPEFVRAYEPDGMKPSEFITYGVTQKLLSQFNETGWAPLESKAIAAECEKAGIHMMDAPVSGGEPKAIDGTLSIMCGGPKALFDKYFDLLKVMGASVVHCGDVNGAGNTVKLANQIIVACNIAACAEAYSLSTMAGVNPEKVFAAIRGGLAGSTVMDAKVPMMMDGNFKPGFKIDLHIKDLNNALDTGHGLGTPMLLTAQVQEMLQWLHNNGDGQSDHSAILKYYERITGVEVRK